LKELAAEKARPKQLLAVVELEKDTAQELTKGSLWAELRLFNEPISALDPELVERRARRHAQAGHRGHDHAGPHPWNDLACAVADRVIVMDEGPGRRARRPA
jgi:hypothetical protein